MILDLQKKIEIEETEETSRVAGDVVATLIALGYEKKEITEMLKNTTLKSKKVEEQVQEALKAIRGVQP